MLALVERGLLAKPQKAVAVSRRESPAGVIPKLLTHW